MKKLREITIVLLLVLSLFSVLVIMNAPTVEATNDPQWNPNGYYETPNADWIIDPYDDDLWENTIIVVNGNLTIQNYGTLTLSNVTLQMNDTVDDAGDKIQVDSIGEFNVINGSIITTDPITPAQSPDPYEFKIEGTALINNSIVEKMADRDNEYDGIQIYSSSVTITNSSVRLSEGNGLYVYNVNPTIKDCNISDNTHHGVYMSSVSNCIFEDNNVSSNDYGGIFLSDSDHNTIANSTLDSNGGSNYVWRGINLGYGIILDYSLDYSDHNTIINNSVTNTKRALPSMGWGYGIVLNRASHNSLKNNTINSNDDLGIRVNFHSDYNIIDDNSVNYNGYGANMGANIHVFSSSNNIISNNNVSYSNYGISISQCSNSYNTIRENIISSNDKNGIVIFMSSHISIKNNCCFNNLNHGIYCYSDIAGIENIKIENNKIYSNTLNGIFLAYYQASCSKHYIANNSIYSNGNNGIYLSSAHNNTITSNNISANTLYGVCLSSSVDNKIGMNNISSNADGINLTRSSNSNLITSNYLANNTNYALHMDSCNNNEIIDNNLEYSTYGANLTSCSNNILYHNNLKNNTINATDNGTNYWDNGLEGNWWGDNLDPTDSDGDGICDSNYTGSNFVDNYPLANEDNDRVLVDDPWFWFIQSGVNFADPGMTVYAKSSTYLENVTINKTLTVIGEDRNSTIIDAEGSKTVVLVDSTAYVNISGFTVRNGTHGVYLNNSDHCVLEDNIMRNGSYGVYLKDSHYCVLHDNNVVDNTVTLGNARGMVFNSSCNNTISNSTIKFNDLEGIWIIESSNDNHIINNTISNNTFGIHVLQSSNILIENNTITNNADGIVSYYSSPIIRYNNISYNTYNGIGDINHSDAVIGNNTITHNDHGIANIEYSNATIDNNTISYNILGIFCEVSSCPIITYNNITFNTNGIYCADGSNAAIHWNNMNNTGYDVNNADPAIWVDATSNYWGSPTGPIPGIDVIGNVIYFPYVTGPIPEAGPG